MNIDNQLKNKKIIVVLTNISHFCIFDNNYLNFDIKIRIANFFFFFYSKNKQRLKRMLCLCNLINIKLKIK